MMKVVGVIGAGAAGLCAARHISATPGFIPVVWEKASKVGGTWVFTPHTGKDEHGLPIHSSMYKNLKTNLPKEVMNFPDFPFPAMEESFIHHTDVLTYLENYSDHYGLLAYIKFEHHVQEVRPVEQNDGPTKWSVTVHDLSTKTTSTTSCDAMVICNGHYSVPRVPLIKDIEKFSGVQIHSHDYREPEPYRDQRVIVLGAAASGLDICLEVATVAKEVILSHNHPIQIPSELPANVRQTQGVVAAFNHGFIFGDGSTAEADAILYCTGYEYTFPFLSKECGVTVEDNIVKPLYKHLIHTSFPSMAFIGIPFQIVPFPLFDYQVRFFLALLTGNATSLTCQEMNADTAHALQHLIHKGSSARHFHQLGIEGTGHYVRELASAAHLPPLEPHCIWLFKVAFLRMLFSCITVKKYRYTVNAKGQVKEWRNGHEVNTTWELIWLITVQMVLLLWRDFPRVLHFVTRTVRNQLGM